MRSRNIIRFFQAKIRKRIHLPFDTIKNTFFPNTGQHFLPDHPEQDDTVVLDKTPQFLNHFRSARFLA